MRERLVLSLLVLPLVFGVAGCATETTTADGLMSARSGRVDELYFRPNTDIAVYRRVLIDPVPVEFANDYLNQKGGPNYLLAQHLDRPYQDPEEIQKDFSALMQASLTTAFRKANYEIASSPGPGVLRIAAKVQDLYINAPDRMSSTTRASFNRDTGQATLSLEAIDSTTGLVLARVVHRNIVRQATRFDLASDTSNRLWFATAFERWASNVTTELGEAGRAQVSALR